MRAVPEVRGQSFTDQRSTVADEFAELADCFRRQHDGVRKIYGRVLFDVVDMHPVRLNAGIEKRLVRSPGRGCIVTGVSLLGEIETLRFRNEDDSDVAFDRV